MQAEKEIDDEMKLKSLEESKKASTLTTYEEARELMKAPQRSLAFKFFDEDGSLGVGPDEFCDVAGRMEPYAWLRPEAERDKSMLQLDTLEKQLLQQAAVQPGVSSHSCWRHGGDVDIYDAWQDKRLTDNLMNSTAWNYLDLYEYGRTAKGGPGTDECKAFDERVMGAADGEFAKDELVKVCALAVLAGL